MTASNFSDPLRLKAIYRHTSPTFDDARSINHLIAAVTSLGASCPVLSAANATKLHEVECSSACSSARQPTAISPAQRPEGQSSNSAS